MLPIRPTVRVFLHRRHRSWRVLGGSLLGCTAACGSPNAALVHRNVDRVAGADLRRPEAVRQGRQDARRVWLWQLRLAPRS